ncbi:MAG: tRNA pseudouridine(38-40) synthase TruA [Clostridia bacterium]|nr:tRNA pseudouridine(38-40) synthase TruA [Clostridia bacterium]
MRYALKIAYDGTNFCGWQIQPNGRTVQAELNAAASKVFGEQIVVTASGRTDSGVHAAGQICHFDAQNIIEGEKVADALNVQLPPDVSVLASAVVGGEFDSNRSAKRKTYVYRLYVSPRRNPLLSRYAVHLKDRPDAGKMREAANLFIGEHDFAAYCASGSAVKTTVRTVYSIDVKEDGDFIDIEVCGNGFLYNMVRTLAGTLLFYAYGRLSKEDLTATVERCDRARVGKTMPPEGLTLKSVDYEINPF